MDKNIALFGIFCGIAVATSFFLAIYFLFIKKKDHYNNNLLGLLFIAIGLRIGKSIAYFIFVDVISVGLALGYLGLASIGPLIFLYINSSDNLEIKFNKKYFLHFVIPFLGLFLCFITHLGHITLLYKSVTVLLGIYLIGSVYTHIKNNYKNTNVKHWNTRLLIAINVLFMSFVSQHLTADVIINYAISAGISSITIYYILIYALKSPIGFSKLKSKNIPLKIKNEVKFAFENKKFYLEQNITLTKFSQDYNIPTYLVTESVKQLYGKRFPEAINCFRIEEVKNVLVSNDDINTKIEVLAYEVGFNTPSSFYAAFKRETNMSPKEFQKSRFLELEALKKPY